MALKHAVVFALPSFLGTSRVGCPSCVFEIEDLRLARRAPYPNRENDRLYK
jgi:hypothetical protein